MVPLLVLVAHFLALGFAQNPCVPRQVGDGRTVCVCNSTYCDTIQRPTAVPPGQILVYTSNQDGLRFARSTSNFKPTVRPVGVTIDRSQKYQTIFGFGGAFTDATGINLNSVSQEVRNNILRSYFSTDGIEYSIGRVPIGGTDFSDRPYSYDDSPVDDPDLTNFKLQYEDLDYKIPYVKQAMNITNGNMILYCSAWTAPKWLKTNGRYSGFGFIRTDMYQTWANYFLKFLEAYDQQGIRFWGVTTGNEPADVLNPFDVLEVVGWPSWLLGRWISENFGPTLRNSKYSDIKIMVLDDQRVFLPWYVQRAFRDNNASQYVDGIAIHWYLDEYIPPDVLTQTHNIYPDKFMLATEACNMPAGEEPPVLLGSWRRGEYYSYDIIQDLQNWVTGWMDWNMVLRPDGGPNYIKNYVDSPVIVNATSNEAYKQPMYYHLGHFSKFVPRGSVRINSTISPSFGLEVIAFQRPDNGTAVVFLNRNSNTVGVDITDGARGTTHFDLSRNSITTVLYW